MNAQELYHALTTLSAIPVGSKEQRCMALLASNSKPMTLIEIVEQIGGNQQSLRSMMQSLIDKKMVSVEGQKLNRFYRLSTAGKKTITKAMS